MINQKGYGDSSKDEENVSLIVWKFNKFFSQLKKNKGKNFIRPRNKEDMIRGIMGSCPMNVRKPITFDKIS